MRDKPADRFMIQIELPKVKADLEAAQSLLKSAGVEVDTSYKPVCVNPKLGRYVRAAGKRDRRSKV